MSRKFRPHFVDPKSILLSNAAGEGILAVGTTVPTDATAGYAPGCIFIDRDSATPGAQIFINEGTALSCDFNGLSATGGVSLNGLLATADEINRSSDMSTRTVNATASTLTVTEALHDGKTIVLDRAAGIAVTLPVPVAGMRFRFVVKTTFVGAASIKSVSGAHIMIGHALMGNDSDNTVVDFQAVAASTLDTIDLFGTANSTGGIEGQIIEIEALSSTVWFVEIRGDAAGTEATPFANTVA